MHPDADALLDAIFDAPDDDTPRLVYADWLQEHGQEAHAQFIRLQCAAARYPLWSDEANRLWEEIGRVWTRLDEEWWPATRDDWNLSNGARLDATHFHRGFLGNRLGLTCDQLARYGETCWPWLPLPETTLSSDPEDEYYEWDEDEEPQFADHESDEGAEPHIPRLFRIQRLHVRGNKWEHLRRLGCWPLVASPQLANLEVLDLGAVNLPSVYAERMLAPGRFPRLREVRLRVFDPKRHPNPAGCLTADVDTSALHLAELRRRLEARFEKVVWRVGP
ncbi:TIGR02996 domain-containing protein [Gemmata sp. JC717]|uniref:TIGR02996 domain-containing protein n=1 Tax=Gemmata algarum TaxID=2975278 RepID=UPI0021BAC2A0|nr:TIGR02996 domain-containing protein [Gemmata algarum]MDY3551208.1 TIGR02996 domain-containing protein [Gemmata algarum]